MATEIKPRKVTTIFADRLSHKLGIDIVVASEAHQFLGSFKFRAALNVAQNVPHDHIITASSGNFGQSLAHACQLVGKRCTVVMPRTAAKVKIQAVKDHGAHLDLVDTNVIGRLERVAQLRKAHPDAYFASAYDDQLVIDGNASLGRELAGNDFPADILLVPIGGGGLASGIITGLAASGSQMQVMGAEPLLANDAARSLRTGQIVANEREPQTVADGARGCYELPGLQSEASINMTKERICSPRTVSGRRS
jgi:threonine dehydratase